MCVAALKRWHPGRRKTMGGDGDWKITIWEGERAGTDDKRGDALGMGERLRH